MNSDAHESAPESAPCTVPRLAPCASQEACAGAVDVIRGTSLRLAHAQCVSARKWTQDKIDEKLRAQRSKAERKEEQEQRVAAVRQAERAEPAFEVAFEMAEAARRVERRPL